MFPLLLQTVITNQLRPCTEVEGLYNNKLDVKVFMLAPVYVGERGNRHL